MRVIFFWKCSKFIADSKNAGRNSEKIFCFWDKCIGFVWIQLTLLIREYLPSVVILLRKRLKNFHVSKTKFSNSITFRVITQDDKGTLINIFMSLRATFATPLPSQWSLKVITALSLRLNQRFSPFTMSPVEGSS